ncbi:hypothetical protein GCM10008101_16870 [Lysobacter xinjiangensis]|uniref:Uncharacterized protein n=1 Tax=Cognatilysobacter xinjiangensis TaxID=546892 RepID=A0ABQ3C6L6_9GAMM|nr:hypothetical protein [Lysobacter xinjiangensis]GGZ63930.1 hypothetical protein GCM10008101_16870 [Lysobacter xinjiangensis]
MHALAQDPVRVPAPIAGRLAVTAVVAIAEAAHLAWEATHGGIVSHHMLGDPSMPAMWNGWGLLVLPAIAWFASARLVHSSGGSWRLQPAALLRLAAAMCAGIAMSAAFAAGRSDIAGYVLLGIALSGLFVRVYRIEYLLGFALGMAYTFGALIPTIIGAAIALASAAIWFGPWRMVRYVVRRAGR